MLETLASHIKEYKKTSILAPIYVVGEVILELLIPFLMASIIDDGVSKGNMKHVFIVGSIMILLSLFSLLFGILSGKSSAIASTGFAKNLRKAMYENIQSFSFSNIDKYSTAGLVTRMTTDVSNVQHAYQMILRTCFRAPMMLIIALFMAVTISPKLSLIFF
ncbi:MAG: ABC transporter ATP-binding protein, partial [Bacilli bacterium]|nr:ABC transporter ATP-binding protein [Bacilli bacterium]